MTPLLLLLLRLSATVAAGNRSGSGTTIPDSSCPMCASVLCLTANANCQWSRCWMETESETVSTLATCRARPQFVNLLNVNTALSQINLSHDNCAVPASAAAASARAARLQLKFWRGIGIVVHGCSARSKRLKLIKHLCLALLSPFARRCNERAREIDEERKTGEGRQLDKDVQAISGSSYHLC